MALAFRDTLEPCVFSFTMDEDRPAGKRGSLRLLSEEMRAELLEGMGFSRLVSPDFSVIKGFGPEEFVDEILVKRLNARAVCCGYDFRFGARAAGNHDTLASLCLRRGLAVEIRPAVLYRGEPISSTRIRAVITQGKIGEANAMLGRPFTLDFPVTRGNQLGRTLDFPTINQIYPADFIAPPRGVYASLTLAGGKLRPSVTNLGVRPTVNKDSGLTAETHILEYSGSLYGKRVKVSLLAFMRPEQKFPSLAALKAQVIRDIAAAAEICAEHAGNPPIYSLQDEVSVL